MNKVILAAVVAFALAGCETKDEVVPNQNPDAVETPDVERKPAGPPGAEAPVDGAPAAEAAPEAPAPEGVDGGKAALP